MAPWAFGEGESDPLWNRPSFEKKVYRVGERILQANHIPDRIVFIVSKLDIRNASASRFGGPNTVIVYKDMLDVLDSDDELAAVLSHEIAHITKRHTGKIVPRRWAAKTALWTAYTVGGTAASVATAGLAAPAFILGAAGIRKMQNSGIAVTGPISRPYEKEADLVGLDYMVIAGYNPLAMETLLLKGAGDSGPVANFFSTHPGGTERLAYVHESIQAHYPQYLGSSDDPPQKSNQPSTQSAALPVSSQTSSQTPSSVLAVNPHGDSSAPSIASPVAAKALLALSSEQASATPTALPEQPGTATQNQRVQPATPALLTKPVVAMATTGTGKPGAAYAVSLTSPSSKVAKGLSQNRLATASLPLPETIPQTSAISPSSSSSSSGNVSSVEAPVSIAQVLLGLQPEQLRILRMLSQTGYLSREELKEQLEYVPEEALQIALNDLLRKRLIRLLGAQPDELIVLTDWASDALKPPTPVTSGK